MLVLARNENKFKLGQVVATSGVYEMVGEDIKFSQFVTNSFTRHCNGDWGDLCEEDKMANDFALLNGGDRLFSSVRLQKRRHHLHHYRMGQKRYDNPVAGRILIRHRTTKRRFGRTAFFVASEQRRKFGSST